ncbi:MAG: TolC family protein [Treponema sp.]|jgi:outer membrane protein TolC|nr:TolC family protein [Treponema sp.]
MNNKKIVTLLLMCLGAVNLPALNLEDARRAAVRSSPVLRKLDLSKQNQALARMAVFFKYLPSLSASVSASYPVLESPAGQGQSLDKLNAAARFSISERVSIFDGGKSRTERSNLALDDSSLDADTQAKFLALIEDADSRYFACLEAEAAVKTAELQVELSSLALETAEIRRAGGILSPSDYFLALADKSAADSSHAAALTGLALARRRLEQLTGLSDTGDLSPVDFENYEELLNRISQWTMEEIVSRCEKIRENLASRSPSLRSAYITLRRAENTYALSRSAFLPSLDLSLSFDLGYNFTGRSSSDPLSYGASVTLGGTIPLDYWVLENALRRQKNTLESSRIDYEDALAAFDIELQSALFTLAGNSRALMASRRQAEYSALLLEQQQELFRLSGTSMASFLDAAARSLSGETAKTKAEFSFLRSLSAIKTLGAFDDGEVLALLLE